MENRQTPRLMLVIPCYQEEAALPRTAEVVLAKLSALSDAGEIAPDSRALLVDDGSRDGTWAIIEALHAAHPARISGLKLSRNCGHQNALLAGLTTAVSECDAAVSMDADLQDDINAIDGFLREYRAGADVVYGVRSKRERDTLFKRTTAVGFYKLMKALGVDIVFNHADYRLLSCRALSALLEFREVNLFLRGLVPLVGFKSAVVTYERGERTAGESKYPLRKMLAFAFDGITSFSVKPIRLISALGFVLFAVSLVMLLYVLIAKLAGRAISGWTSVLASIWMIGGIQLLSLGVIGEYIGKIYREVKARPRFIVETYLK